MCFYIEAFASFWLYTCATDGLVRYCGRIRFEEIAAFQFIVTVKPSRIFFMNGTM